MIYEPIQLTFDVLPFLHFLATTLLVAIQSISDKRRYITYIELCEFRWGQESGVDVMSEQPSKPHFRLERSPLMNYNHNRAEVVNPRSIPQAEVAPDI